MPLTHQTLFRVRHYECDAYGHLNNANYLRYMEQAAIEASAAVGYDDARYAALGTVWLIHETDIEYLLPLRAGDEVVVTTWVADFRRVRSRRRYEFRRAGDEVLIARATTDWAYLDKASGRPVAIPTEMSTAFDPAGEQAAREALPPAPPPPPRPYVLARRAEWRDIDMAMHVNNANYLSYMEEAAVESLGAFGWSMERLMADDIAIVARRHRIVYEGQAKLGDLLHVTTFLAEVRRATAVRHFSITRAGETAPIARAHSSWVFVHPSSAQVARVPERILVDFAEHIAPSL